MKQKYHEPCADCGQSFVVPFDCGDDKVRCAGCATERYMSKPYVKVMIFAAKNKKNNTLFNSDQA